MFRKHGSTTFGGSFDAATIEAVWRKGRMDPFFDPNLFRRDCCGALISWAAYGTTSAQGWEIDHNMPVSRGGPDVLFNLQPLHWENNRSKSDNWPNWACKVPSRG